MHCIHRLRYAAVLFGLAASTFFIAMGGDRTLMSAPWWLLLGTAFSPLFVFIGMFIEPDIPEQDSGPLLLGTLGSLSLLLGFSSYWLSGLSCGMKIHSSPSPLTETTRCPSTPCPGGTG